MIPFVSGCITIAACAGLWWSGVISRLPGPVRVLFVLWVVAVVVLTDWRPVTAWIGMPLLVGKGGGEAQPSTAVQAIVILSLVVATALGVVAQVWFERRILKESNEQGWDDTLILSVIVAVIILLPVFGTLNEQILKADLLWPKITALFLGFENGFLWKGYIKRRLEQKRNA